MTRLTPGAGRGETTSVPPFCLAFILACSSLPFGPALQGQFVFDDLPAIVNNPDVNGTVAAAASIGNVFRHDFWGDSMHSPHSHKSYRPFTVLAFNCLARLFTLNSPGYFHALNLALHASNTGLVYLLISQLVGGRRRFVPFVTSLFFAWHPVHVESVAGVVGLADLAYTHLTLLALLTGRRGRGRTPTWRRWPLVMLLAAVAVLFKEQGIMLIPMVLAQDAIYEHRLLSWPRASIVNIKLLIKKTLLGLSWTACLLYQRLRIMDFQAPQFQEPDNPAAFHPSWLVRTLNYHYQYAINAWLLLVPDWLCFDWAMGCLSLVLDLWDVRLLAVVGLWSILLSLAVFALKHSSHRSLGQHVAFALAVLILPFLPASNALFRVGFVIAERNLYLPVLGHALIVALCLDALLRRPNVTKSIEVRIKIALTLLLVCFFAKSFVRSLDWQTEESLFRSGLKVCPNNAKVYYNIAKRASDFGQPAIALSGYEQALRLYPDYEHALNNLGNLHRHDGRLAEAERLLERAVRVRPSFAAAWMNLGIVQTGLHRFEAAETSYGQALRLRKHYPDCLFNLGNLYLKTNEPDEAMSAFERAIQQSPEHKSAWANLIILADEQDNYQLAETKALMAVELFPKMPEFYFHLANIYGKQDLFLKAEAFYLKAIKRKDNSSLYYGNLGVLYHRWKKYQQAVECYEKSLELNPNNAGSRKNLKSLKKMTT